MNIYFIRQIHIQGQPECSARFRISDPFSRAVVVDRTYDTFQSQSQSVTGISKTTDMSEVGLQSLFLQRDIEISIRFYNPYMLMLVL